MIIRVLIILVSLVVFSPKVIFADKALITIEFDLNEISDVPKPPSKGRELAHIPYKEVQKYYDEISEKDDHGRIINIKWDIVNYEFVENIFSEEFKGYHLFDITWFNQQLRCRYKSKDGAWKKLFSMPTMFTSRTPSDATIIGYGDIPVSMTGRRFSLQKKLTIWDLEKVIENNNYKIVITRYPDSRQHFLILSNEAKNDKKIKGQKLHILGNSTLGTSVIKTEKNPFFYPFDEYSFNFVYKSHYPSEVTLIIEDIKNLELSPENKKIFKIKEHQEEEIKFYLIRKDKMKNYFLPVVAALIPLLGYIFKKKSVSWWLRLSTYVFAFFLLYYTSPTTPPNVPKLNLFNFTWVFYIGFIFYFEVYSFMKFFKKNKERTLIEEI